MAEFGAIVWIAMPLVVAAGASIVTAFLMHARAEIAAARDRQALVEARALLGSAQRILEERVEAAEQEARRRALEEFLGDVRVEERQFVRNFRKTTLIQERVCFREIPLTPWFERDIPAVPALVTRQSATVEVLEPIREPRRLLG